MGLVFSSEVRAPLAEVYAWHERPGALARLSPPWLPLRIRSEAESLRDGRAVLALPGGYPLVARHSGYDPPHRFVDELTTSPVPWRHTHEFSAVSADTTRMTDTVETPLPSALLRGMFTYRHRQLAADLAAHRWAAGLLDRSLSQDRRRRSALTVAVTGSSGLVGSALCALLTTGGHRVVRLVRREARNADERSWNPGRPASGMLAGVDAVVHLAGATIAGRFTAEHKREVRDSRLGPTRALAELAGATVDGPRTFVTASAIGYYGADRGDEPLVEDSDPGDGFLAEVVTAWEQAAAPAADAGLRTVVVRTGLVQSPAGGQLRAMLPLFVAGLGGRLGSGRQWMSWIGIDDLVDVYLRAIVDDTLAGPVNAVAPEPMRNTEYTRVLARVLRRPALIPVPAFGPRLILGTEGAAEIAEASQRVLPGVLSRLGHRYRHDDLAAALGHVLGREAGQCVRDQRAGGRASSRSSP
ncbi:MAG: TIGR01777 family protein [Streptosporangiales bacterium]|nr:TIGR01777 family protein [Streptosporangiales bacterium]